MTPAKRRPASGPSQQEAPATPARSAGAPQDAGHAISWRHCLVGILAGEVLLLLTSNVARGVANAAFGTEGLNNGDGGIIGVSSLVAVIFGAFLAARLAGRFGLYQGIVVGIGFIILGALFQLALEAQIVQTSLSGHTHRLVDLGPMRMGDLLSGDFLALFGGSVGGLLSGRR
ncbi:MAG: hypothetical protein ABR564_02725 [Candidatus Dormibacteria bacterium]